MAKSTFKFQLFGLAEVRKKYRTLAQRYSKSHQRHVMFKKMAVYMWSSIGKNFRAEGRPDRWKKLKRSTINARLRGRSKAKGREGKAIRTTAAGRAQAARKLRRLRAGGSGTGVRSVRILQDTGRLRHSVGPTNVRNSVWRIKGPRLEFGTNLKYAQTQHFGDAKRNIPARPFLLFQRQDVKRLSGLLRKDVRQWNRDNTLRKPKI